MARFLILPVASVVACAILGGTAPAGATATTHIWAPSTDVQALNRWHVTSDIYLPAERDAAGDRIPAVTNVGLTVGVLPMKALNLELGVDHKSGLGPLDDYPMYGNLKLGVPEGAFGAASPALAIGVFDVGTEPDRTDFNVAYAKVAKTLPLGRSSLGRISLGYFSGSRELLLDPRGARDNHGVLAAWERTCPEISERLWVCLEYTGSRSAYGAFSVGAAWKCGDNVALLVGYDKFNSDEFVDTATVQVDIDL
jgi:hypothetical protein